jgi:hypothetical protein
LRVRSTTALGLAALLALTACGGGSDDGASAPADAPSADDQSAEAPKPPVESFPVGEPFEEAVWSVKVSLPSTGGVVKTRDNPVKVRGDRLIVEYEELDGARGIVAFAPDGAPVWSHEVSQMASIGVLDSTVAILQTETIEGSGLEKDTSTVTLTLLSQQDGSTVAEMQDPDLNRVKSISDFGEILVFGDPLRYVSEDGAIHEAGQYDPQVARGIPFIEDGLAEVVPLDPSIEELDDAFRTDIRAIARKQEVAILQIAYGATSQYVTYAVNAESGDVIGKLDCNNAKHTDSDTNVAYSSPNGRYGVLEAYWISGDEVRCYAGDRDTRGVEFTAVDDNGTAYGTTLEMNATVDPELVVIAADGSIAVSPLPQGASAPVGIMEGGIAIHVRGDTITGNPIR